MAKAKKAAKRPAAKRSAAKTNNKRPAAKPAKKPAAKPAPAAHAATGKRPACAAGMSTPAAHAATGKRPACAAGMSRLAPYLTVKNVQSAIDFYEKAFGFAKKSAMPGPGGRLAHAEMKWYDCVFMFGAEGIYTQNKSPIASGAPCPISLYVYCDDVDAQCQRAATAGATVMFPPKDMFYGDRVCLIQDPDGYHWNFATNVADFDPSKAPH